MKTIVCMRQRNKPVSLRTDDGVELGERGGSLYRVVEEVPDGCPAGDEGGKQGFKTEQWQRRCGGWGWTKATRKKWC